MMSVITPDSNNKPQNKLPIWYHPIYTNGISPKARFPRDRYTKLLDRLTTTELGTKFGIMEPKKASRSELILAHDPYYVDNFLNQTLTEKEVKRIGLTPWTPEIIPRTLLLIGGAISALEQVVTHGGIAGNMAGGTHHAHFDFGSGYCIFNDLAVCSMIAIKKYGISKIAILDFDVHQGDGTATILQNVPEVLTISIHCQQNFPFRKSISDYDLDLPSKADDTAYLEMVRKALKLTEGFEPELILFQAGVDGLTTDSLGKLNVSREGMKLRNDLVFDYVIRDSIPTVVFMGGGYSEPISHTIDAFCDLFVSASQANETILSKAD